jgi:hypothetical protein
LAHLLLAASIPGHIVRGPVTGGDSAFVSVPDWLGRAPAPLRRDEALARLARRYLRGHGPADARDLAKWAGIGVGDARRGLDGIGGELVPFGTGLLQLADGDAPAPLPLPRLLGPFDPVLLGWVSRQLLVGPHQHVVTTNGLFRPVGLVEGRVMATWGLAGGTVEIRPLQPIAQPALDALRHDALDVLRFLGLSPKPAVVAALQ